MSDSFKTGQRGAGKTSRMNIALKTVNLEVMDVARSTRFYSDLFGMMENKGRSHPPSFVYLESAGCALTLTIPPGGGQVQPSRSIELGFETDDIRAFQKALDSAGVSNFRPQSMGWGDAVELHDPDGNRVIVYQFRR